MKLYCMGKIHASRYHGSAYISILRSFYFVAEQALHGFTGNFNKKANRYRFPQRPVGQNLGKRDYRIFPEIGKHGYDRDPESIYIMSPFQEGRFRSMIKGHIQ